LLVERQSWAADLDPPKIWVWRPLCVRQQKAVQYIGSGKAVKHPTSVGDQTNTSTSMTLHRNTVQIRLSDAHTDAPLAKLPWSLQCTKT